ncbi:MAG: PD-(D/E)XK nuclease family transposase [Candidatus Riflebacteria bacterium]|nr:PD-(D/E)XK nuclease family transposase [Candidatus Riflebacteria bacterium]
MVSSVVQTQGGVVVGKRRLVSFDWAMKRLLRSKANFKVLEGFLFELLKEEIRIVEILESESNQESRFDKFNRLDLKAKTSNEEVILIEVQYEQEFDYLQRILFSTFLDQHHIAQVVRKIITGAKYANSDFKA